MAFKKKAKAPKKKSKSAKKDDWTFEGGVGAVEQQQEDEPRKKRRTQDRDERQRRGRAKIDISKRKKQFTNKMSKKIKFSDVLEKDVSSASVDTEIDSKKVTKEVRLNPLSVNDRLALFVSKSLDNSTFRGDNASREAGKSLRAALGNDSDTDSGDESDEESSINVDITADHDVADEEEEGDGNGHESDDDEVNNDGAVPATNGHDAAVDNANYDWFFSSSSESSASSADGKKTASMKLLRTMDSLESDVYTGLNPAVSSNIHSSYASIASLPGLHKLWRSGDNDSGFSDVCGELLPLLNTYADTLIESKDRTQDSELLHAMMVHAATHAVKSRAKVLKHNQKLKKRAKDALLAAALADAGKGDKGNKKRKHSAPAVTNDIAPSSSSGVIGSDEAEELAAHDQGFCRPRVLILCPFRGSAVEVIRSLERILGPNTSVSGLEKLNDEFGPPDEDAADDDLDYGGKAGKSSGNGPQRKPADWEALFKDRNIDDDFKVESVIVGTGAMC